MGEGLKHIRRDDIVEFARGNVLIKIGKNDYSAEVMVATRRDGTMLMYDVLNMEKTTIEKRNQSLGRLETRRTPDSLTDPADISIPEATEKSNGSEKIYAKEKLTPEDIKEKGYDADGLTQADIDDGLYSAKEPKEITDEDIDAFMEDYGEKATAMGSGEAARKAYELLTRMYKRLTNEYEENGEIMRDMSRWKGNVHEIAQHMMDTTGGTGLTIRQVENRIKKVFSLIDEAGGQPPVGGEGSGNFGHKGRPGGVGGRGEGGGASGQKPAMFEARRGKQGLQF